MGIQGALLYNDSTLWLSYLIAAALLFKDSTLWISQQTYFTMAEPFGYPSSPTVQGQ